MKCKCGSERILSALAHCSDSFNMQYQGKDYDGYVPSAIFGNTYGGDSLNITFCLDCGQMLNFKSVSDETIDAVFEASN